MALPLPAASYPPPTLSCPHLCPNNTPCHLFYRMTEKMYISVPSISHLCPNNTPPQPFLENKENKCISQSQVHLTYAPKTHRATFSREYREKLRGRCKIKKINTTPLSANVKKCAIALSKDLQNRPRRNISNKSSRAILNYKVLGDRAR